MRIGRGSALTSTTSQALLQLTDTSLSAFTLLFNGGGQVKLEGGSLLNAGNAIVVNNAIMPTATLNGLPVSATGGRR